MIEKNTFFLISKGLRILNCDTFVFLINATIGHRMNLLPSLKIYDMI